MRVLVKLSGEALSGDKGVGFDANTLKDVALKIKKVVENGNEVGLVVGAGNFIRGAELGDLEIGRCSGDSMGMLAININAIALKEVLENIGVKAKVVNSFSIDGVAERFDKTKVDADMIAGVVMIFAGGTGNPFFTTDTAGVLRALEINADVMIKATKVNGVYTKDPKKYSDAEFLSELDYDTVIQKGLRVMDMTSIVLAKENNLTLQVLSLFDDTALLDAVSGQKVGTIIKRENI